VIFGKGLTAGYLSESEVRATAAEGLAALPVDGRRVLVLIPDSTRTMPMPLVYGILERELGPRVTALDYLVALGTHAPMSDDALSRHIGQPVSGGHAGARRIFNHRWDDPATFITLGTIPAAEIERLTNGICRQPVSVTLNRLILDYDHILICGPVFPHEVAGFSGGAKYFFPGIAGAEIIDFTHWLGALVTNFEIIGTRDTVVRAVIHRAVALIDRPHSLLAPVVTNDGVAGIYCGPTVETWQAASALSGERHVVRLDKPMHRVLAILPSMYTDLWTGAKGMYKVERAIADGGEVVIYAPHISEVSHVHGQLIDEIGYHCRDYFLGQWDSFKDYPGGVLAHSTHLRGLGSWDGGRKVETLRIQVTLATAISEEHCRRLNLGYINPDDIEANDGSWSVIPNAGETLYCVSTIAFPHFDVA
jgi:lactate racemase